MRQMTMVGVLQAQNCTNFVGSWRHPRAMQDFTSAEYYRRIGRALEAGRFHPGFFDDRLAMPDPFGGDHAHTAASGIRCVKMDPVTILSVMGMATEWLGLGATFSTTYYVADGLEEWFASRASDGFVVAASHVPGVYENFSRLVVAGLQRRGLVHLDYKGATLRENLGLDRPFVGAWRQVKH